jgi:hypothetical protein
MSTTVRHYNTRSRKKTAEAKKKSGLLNRLTSHEFLVESNNPWKTEKLRGSWGVKRSVMGIPMVLTPQTRSPFIGISALAFVPLIIVCSELDKQLLATWWMFQMYLCFASDYWTAGITSWTHGADRIMAPISTVVLIYFVVDALGVVVGGEGEGEERSKATAAYRRPQYLTYFPLSFSHLIAIAGAPALFSWVLAQRARRNGERMKYAYLHGMWHYLGTAVAWVSIAGGALEVGNILKGAAGRSLPVW